MCHIVNVLNECTKVQNPRQNYAHAYDIYVVTPPSVYNESIWEIAANILAQPQRQLEKLAVLHQLFRYCK